MRKYPVHVVPVEGDMTAAVQRLAATDALLTSSFDRGDKVILKPNFVAPRKASTGATTSLELIRALAGILKDLGTEPYLCESPGMEYTWQQVFSYLGIEQLAKETGIQVVHCPSTHYVEVAEPENIYLRSIQIPEVVRGAKILNLPKLKTHVTTRVTLGMKNLMGLCHDATKRWMHVRGIEDCIADLNRILKPAYTVVDGQAAMEGDGGVYGNRRDLNALVGGGNVVAVDQVCCALMGVNPLEIPHIAALRSGIEAEIIGALNPERFHLPLHAPLYHSLYRGLYAIDYFFQILSTRHFNQWLYQTGYFGTRPKIKPDVCDRCEECIKVCPADCIDLETLRINAHTCIRCMDCFDVCPIDAIEVRGFSNPHNAAA